MEPVSTYSHLEPGDVLTQQECEEIVGVKRAKNHEGYQFKLMALQQAIHRDLWRNGNRHTVVIHDYGIAVLDAPEASQYNAKTFEAGICKAKRANMRMQGVDVRKLNGVQKRTHERVLAVQGAILSAVARTRRALSVTPVKRNTPAAIESSGVSMDADH